MFKNQIPGCWNFGSVSKAALIFVTTSKRKTSTLQTIPTVRASSRTEVIVSVRSPERRQIYRDSGNVKGVGYELKPRREACVRSPGCGSGCQGPCGAQLKGLAYPVICSGSHLARHEGSAQNLTSSYSVQCWGASR